MCLRRGGFLWGPTSGVVHPCLEPCRGSTRVGHVWVLRLYGPVCVSCRTSKPNGYLLESSSVPFGVGEGGVECRRSSRLVTTTR